MKFVPLTKIWATIFVSILAIAMKTPELLLALFGVEVLLMLISGILFRQWKALFALIGFSAFLGIVQYLGSWSVDSAGCNSFAHVDDDHHLYDAHCNNKKRKI